MLSFARRNGIRFEVALGKLLDKRSLSANSSAVKALNFANPSVRGTDLKRSILSSEMFSKNIFNFKKNLMTTVGAKNESDLGKKILDFEFRSPLILLNALAAQFNRLEMRYILNGISFQEAFARRRDFDHAFMCICSDLAQFGVTPDILHYIFEFSSELIDPKFDVDSIKTKNVDLIARNNNTKNKPNNDVNVTAYAAEAFAFNGNEIEYNMNEDMACQIKLTKPISNLYESKRAHLGSDKKQTLKERWIAGERPKYCPNKSCWQYNWGVEGCPHSEPCKNKKDEHELTHYCAYCGEGAKHRILECEFLRCCTVLVKCEDSNWLSRSYSLELQRIYYPRNNRRGNRRGGNSRGGYRNSYNNNPSNRNRYNNQHYMSYDMNMNNNNYGSYDNFGSYNSGGFGDMPPQHYNDNYNNGGRRGGRGKRRHNRDNNNNNNNGQYSAPHNGNA